MYTGTTQCILFGGVTPPNLPNSGGVPRREAPFGGVPFGGVSPPQAENFGDLGSFGGVPAFRRVIQGGRIPGGPQTLEDALVRNGLISDFKKMCLFVQLTFLDTMLLTKKNTSARRDLFISVYSW